MAMKFGIAIAARIPMMTTTIMSSISVKPWGLRLTWVLSALGPFTMFHVPRLHFACPGTRGCRTLAGFGGSAQSPGTVTRATVQPVAAASLFEVPPRRRHPAELGAGGRSVRAHREPLGGRVVRRAGAPARRAVPPRERPGA